MSSLGQSVVGGVHHRRCVRQPAFVNRALACAHIYVRVANPQSIELHTFKPVSPVLYGSDRNWQRYEVVRKAVKAMPGNGLTLPPVVR